MSHTNYGWRRALNAGRYNFDYAQVLGADARSR